jgi:hypothetical protein
MTNEQADKERDIREAADLNPFAGAPLLDQPQVLKEYDRPLSFARATALYVNRYTMEHVPNWAKPRAHNGRYYAPHFRTDREWYDHTRFNGESEMADKGACYTTGHTWPLGQWLDAPYGQVDDHSDADDEDAF